jgi:DGQHR domain-containing protein
MPRFDIPCIMVDQRNNETGPKFAMFAAPAGEIAQWAAIRRRTETPQGTQRALNKSKLNALSNFLQKDARNTIPPAITITLRVEPGQIEALDVARNFAVITLELPEQATEEQKPGLIIDGQHRLFGIDAYSHTCSVNVVALLNVSDLETAFQFLVINNKVTPVQPDHIRTLALDYAEGELSERLKTARLTLHANLPYVGIMDTDEESPFRGLISLVVSADQQPENRFIPPAAIENAIAVVQKKEVRELKSDDALCEFVYAIWSCLKENDWAELWEPASKLMTKAGIIAMTSFVTDALIAKYDYAGDLDVSDPAKVREQVQLILQYQTPEFWKTEWTLKISDALAVRTKIIDSLTKIYRNLRANVPWHEDLDLVAL